MTLLAHHIELQHLPVLAVFLGVGAWLGWQLVSRTLAGRKRADGAPRPPHDPPAR